MNILRAVLALLAAIVIPACVDGSSGDAAPASTTTGGTNSSTDDTPPAVVVTPQPPGTLEFESSAYGFSETPVYYGPTLGPRYDAITVTRTGGSKGVVTATIIVPEATATWQQDYLLPSYDGQPLIVLRWEDGDASPKTFSFMSVEDVEMETDETVDLEITGTTGGATIGAKSRVRVTIIDDDTPRTP